MFPGHFDYGPLCFTKQSPVSKVLHEIQPSRGRSDRYSDIILAWWSPACISSSTSHLKVDQENKGAEGEHSGDSSRVAQTTLIFGPEELAGGFPSYFTSFSRHAATGSDLASRPRLVSVSHLDVEHGTIIGFGYPSSVVDFLLGSRRKSTLRIYNTTWKAVIQWCRKKCIPFLSPSLSNMLTFLQDGLSSSLKSSTPQRQVIALASVILNFNGITLLAHPHVKRFLRGATLKTPPPQGYTGFPPGAYKGFVSIN